MVSMSKSAERRSMNIQERLEALRQRMAKRDLEAYIIPTSDPHQSEYVPDHYKARVYMSGLSLIHI